MSGLSVLRGWGKSALCLRATMPASDSMLARWVRGSDVILSKSHTRNFSSRDEKNYALLDIVNCDFDRSGKVQNPNPGRNEVEVRLQSLQCIYMRQNCKTSRY